MKHWKNTERNPGRSGRTGPVKWPIMRMALPSAALLFGTGNDARAAQMLLVVPDRPYKSVLRTLAIVTTHYSVSNTGIWVRKGADGVRHAVGDRCRLSEVA